MSHLLLSTAIGRIVFSLFITGRMTHWCNMYRMHIWGVKNLLQVCTGDILKFDSICLYLLSCNVRKIFPEGVPLLTANSFQTGSKNPPNQTKVPDQTIKKKKSEPFYYLSDPNYLVWWLWPVVKRETKQEMAKLNGKKKKKVKKKSFMKQTDNFKKLSYQE